MDFKTTKERLAWREAFLSLNERKIRAECNRRNVILPEDDFSFWKSVHKSITAFEKLDITLWARSALWLKQNGSSPLTDRWAEYTSSQIICKRPMETCEAYQRHL